jgi:hypothetical protein
MKKTLSLIVVGVLLGSAVTFAATEVFSDVPENAWYSSSVNNLSEKGIIQGYSDGTFGPTNNVNRAELAVMLDRVLQYVDTGSVYTCDNMYSKFDCESLTADQCSAIPYVKWAKENCGLGTPGNEIGL